jgi:glutamate carboxypeptidase
MNYSLQTLIEYTKSHHDEMVHQLHEFCNINSGSDNLSGLKHMRTFLENAYQSIADDIETITMPQSSIITMDGQTNDLICGDALFIRKRPNAKRRILLTGHMDTVYSINHPFQTLKQLDENVVNGPGVSDMKGGLIVMLHALTAFESIFEQSDMGWDVLINADEEIGSPTSAALLDDLSSNYQAGLVYEPAMDKHGTLAKNRKGSGKLTLVAHGKAAHAGRSFYEGRNAICYLAEIIIAIHQLNGKRDGVTINVGKISGGDVLNSVPEKAVTKLDIRITQPEDEAWVRAELDNISQRHEKPGYTLEVDGAFSRPVKQVNAGTKALFERIQKVGKQLGIEIDWKDSGGCCDGNNLAQRGLPVIDTLGVRGGNIHSSDEYILLDSLVERATLSGLLLADLADGGLEQLVKR